MNHLFRSLAPVTDRGWSVIDDEARARLHPGLAARRLVDFVGPHGFDYSSHNLGHTGAVAKAPVDGVDARLREVLPLAEVRVPFVVARDALLDVERGASDIDLDDLERACGQLALLENIAVLHGWDAAGIIGVTDASTQDAVPLGVDVAKYPVAVAVAVDALRAAGVDGPYGLALGPSQYTGVLETAERGGHLVLDHLRTILDGPVVWAPGLRGGVVVSLRGDDFVFDSGEDIAVGYSNHDAENVALYLEETFTFHVDSPDAAVALTV